MGSRAVATKGSTGPKPSGWRAAPTRAATQRAMGAPIGPSTAVVAAPARPTPPTATELTRAASGRFAPLPLVGPPAGAPVLKPRASEPPIGLPLSAIPASRSFPEGLALLERRGLPRFEKLSAAERAHETAFADSIGKNLGLAVEAFTKASWDPRLGTHVFEVDAAKRLHEGYGTGKAPANPAEAALRLQANHALHPTATAVARLAFLKRLDELAVLPETSPKRAVLVTSGGCAAGKGSLSELVRRLQGDFDFGAVWDAAGEGEALENGWVLEAAQARGLKVTFGFVENDPLVQYDDVLGRAEGTGRVVDPVTFARSYARGSANMKAFLDSPAYSAAVGRGQATTIGLFTGKFDVASLKDRSLPPYPQLRVLGEDGLIAAEHLTAPPPEARIVERALEQLDAFRDRRAAEGKSTEALLAGALGTLTKWQEA